MNYFDAYRLYLAIKTHFKNDNYDYIKYSGKIKANIHNLQNKPEKYFFQKVAKMYNENEWKDILISNFFKNPNIWIKDLLSTESRDTYLEFKKYNDNFDYYFEDDLETLHLIMNLKKIKFKDLLNVVHKGQHPLILRLYLSNEININTLIIFNEIFGLFNKWDEQIEDSVVWPEIRKKCLKYRSFCVNLIKDKKKYIKMIHKKFI